MNDLKIIEGLLCDLKWALDYRWLQVEEHSSVTRIAMERLRKAWFKKQLREVTLSLATYFERTKGYE